MRSTGIDRRQLLAAMAAGAFTGLVPLAARAGSPAAYIATRREIGGSFAAAVFDAQGRVLFTEALQGRGHDIAVAPNGSLAVVFARRPGRFALVIDLEQQARRLAFTAMPGRHFYGHGFFSPDARLLYATENDYEAGRGVLGVYDVAAGFARIGEFDAGGIGPHQALLVDERTVAVANGGIRTHPDHDREKLNLATMRPNLAYVDRETGDLLDRVELPESYRRLSIRHACADGKGRVWFGGQYEGDGTDPVPLLGHHRRGGEIGLVSADAAIWTAMNNYVGAVALSADGGRIAATSPRGGVVTVWDADSRRHLSSMALPDVCAVGPAPGGSTFVTADGLGAVYRGRERLALYPGIAWDNHLSRL